MTPRRAIGSEHLIIVKIHPVSKIKLHSLPTFPFEFLICMTFLAYLSVVNVCPHQLVANDLFNMDLPAIKGTP